MRRIRYRLVLIAAVGATLVVSGAAQSRGTSKRSDVPMTRPEALLAVHDNRAGHSSTFVELEAGRILQLAGTRFMTSDDGGITWSKSFQRKDTNGKLVGGGEGP